MLNFDVTGALATAKERFPDKDPKAVVAQWLSKNAQIQTPEGNTGVFDYQGAIGSGMTDDQILSGLQQNAYLDINKIGEIDRSKDIPILSRLNPLRAFETQGRSVLDTTPATMKGISAIAQGTGTAIKDLGNAFDFTTNVFRKVFGRVVSKSMNFTPEQEDHVFGAKSTVGKEIADHAFAHYEDALTTLGLDWVKKPQAKATSWYGSTAQGLVEFMPEMMTVNKLLGLSVIGKPFHLAAEALAEKYAWKTGAQFAGRSASRALGGAAQGAIFGGITAEDGDRIEKAKSDAYGFASGELIFGTLGDLLGALFKAGSTRRPTGNTKNTIPDTPLEPPVGMPSSVDKVSGDIIIDNLKDPNGENIIQVLNTVGELQKSPNPEIAEKAQVVHNVFLGATPEEIAGIFNDFKKAYHAEDWPKAFAISTWLSESKNPIIASAFKSMSKTIASRDFIKLEEARTGIPVLPFSSPVPATQLLENKQGPAVAPGVSPDAARILGAWAIKPKKGPAGDTTNQAARREGMGKFESTPTEIKITLPKPKTSFEAQALANELRIKLMEGTVAEANADLLKKSQVQDIAKQFGMNLSREQAGELLKRIGATDKPAEKTGTVTPAETIDLTKPTPDIIEEPKVNATTDAGQPADITDGPTEASPPGIPSEAPAPEAIKELPTTELPKSPEPVPQQAPSAIKTEEVSKPVEAPKENIVANVEKSTEKIGKDPEVGTMDTDQINVHPEMQFKKAGKDPKTGATGSLDEVQTAEDWNRDIATTIQVWRNPEDNKVYVVNGHNRLAKAKELGVKTMNVQFIEGKTLKDVKKTGALTNIAEGHGTVMDAAAYLRSEKITAEEMKKRGVKMTNAQARDGMGIAQLSDSLYPMVERGEIPVKRAAIIGETLGGKPREQALLLDMINRAEKRGKTVTDVMVRTLADEVINGPKMKVESDQTVLPGMETDELQNLALERASFIENEITKLKGEKRLFKLVSDSKTAEKLKATGNILNIGENKKVKDQAELVLDLFQDHKNTNPISGIINGIAQRVGRGENVGKVYAEGHAKIVDAIERIAHPGREPGLRGPELKTDTPIRTDEAGGAPEGEIKNEALGEDMFAPKGLSETEASTGKGLIPESTESQAETHSYYEGGKVGPDNYPEPLGLPAMTKVITDLNGGRAPAVVDYMKLISKDELALIRTMLKSREDEAKISGLISFLKHNYQTADDVIDRLILTEDAMEARKILIDEILKTKKLGWYRPGENQVYLRSDLVEKHKAEKVMSHEIGHFLDFFNKGVGNILGKVGKTIEKFLKSSIGQLPETPDTFIPKEELAKISKIVQKEADQHFPRVKENQQQIGGGDSSNAARKKFMKERREELVNIYAEDNGFYTKNQVMKELIANTEWRRGTKINFDADGKPVGKYSKYLMEKEELYADMVSTIMTNPEGAFEKMPRVYQMWFNYMERSADMKSKYEEVQNIIHSGQMGETLDLTWKKGMKEGEQAMKSREEKIQKSSDWWLSFKTFFKQFAPTDQLKKKIEAKIGKIPPSEDPVYKVEDMIMSGGSKKVYSQLMLNKVEEALKEKGYNREDFALFTAYRRIALGDRDKYFNPGGTTAQAAKERLSSLPPKMTKDFEEIHKDFIDNRFKVPVPKIVESRVFSKETNETIQENKYYVPWAVIDYIDQASGGNTGSVIKRSIGTMKLITNPIDAAYAKDIMLLGYVSQQVAKRGIVDVMLKYLPDDIKEAKLDKNKQPLPSKEIGEDTISYMQDGKVKHYYVKKHLAEQFEKNPEWMGATSKALTTVLQTNFFRDVFVGINTGFQAFNLKKDFWRTYRNIPNGNLLLLARLTKKHINESFKASFGDPSENIQRMYQKGLLVSASNYKDIEPDDLMYERLLKKWNDNGEWGSKVTAPTKVFFRLLKDLQANPVKGVRNTLETSRKVGQSTEIIGKSAADEYLQATNPGRYSDEEATHIVRAWASTPPSLFKGRGAGIYNNILLFSNIYMRGLEYDYEAFKADPLGNGIKTLTTAILPKIFFHGVLLGAAGLAWKRMAQKVGQYDTENYNVVPVGEDSNGKVVLLRFPLDETGRVAGGLTTILLNAITKKQGPGFEDFMKLLSFTGGQAPNLSPAIGALTEAGQFASNINPYDYFRGSNAIPDKIWAAGRMESLPFFMKHLWNELGGSVAYRFNTSNVDEIQSELGSFLGKPFISGTLGRFIKVTDQGYYEKLKEAGQSVTQKESLGSLKLDAVLSKIQHNIPLSADDQSIAREAYARNPQGYKAKQKNLQIKSSGLLGKVLSQAPSRASKNAIMLKYAELTGESPEDENGD